MLRSDPAGDFMGAFYIKLFLIPCTFLYKFKKSGCHFADVFLLVDDETNFYLKQINL